MICFVLALIRCLSTRDAFGEPTHGDCSRVFAPLLLGEGESNTVYEVTGIGLIGRMHHDLEQDELR